MASASSTSPLHGACSTQRTAPSTSCTTRTPRCAAKLQAEAVYGLPELHAAQIKSARLVANPGCYATSVILGLAPLVRANLVDLEVGIIADSKSGVSGAGKAPTSTTHFMYAADNLSAYAVFNHRHTGELREQLATHARADSVHAPSVAYPTRNSFHALRSSK